ncbi:MAG: GGDEF domain-containing protein [Piscirickettsiaceae bacterium]|nr:GGDEF domain-containing protein [Piscirickettsiaceae bacterium]
MSANKSFPPVYTDPAQQATENLRQVIPLINKHKTPINPVNYAVWYEYVSGENQKLNTEIDVLLNNNQLISSKVTQSLYEKYVLHGMPERLEKANTGLSLVVDNTLENINKVASSTDDYIADLTQSQNTLDSYSDIDELKATVQDILSNTQTLLNNSHVLKNDLNQSSREIEQLKEELAIVKEIAQTDALTGLLNRGALDKELSTLCQQASRKAAVLLFDLDHFKQVNDSFGHVIGDKILQFFSSILKEKAGKEHIAARFGGEEMVLILFDLSQQEAIDIANTIRTQYSTSKLKQTKSGQEIGELTVSAGISLFQIGDTPTSLIDRADQALYKSKENGRNQVHVN